jgi:leader peptidase (prepilin peptidase)/N-methyltransferase
MDAFALPAWLPLAVAPFVGSFLGVVILRLPRRGAIVLSRSACDHCGTVLRPRDLVPLASFALRRGRCHHCGGAIGWFHPAVEAAALGIAIWAVLASATPQLAWASCLLGWCLLTLAWIDALSMLLPDILTLPLLLAGLGLADPANVFWHALGAAGGYLGLGCVAWCYHALRGRQGLGEGDAKLLAAAGAWLGVAALPWVVLLAALGGLGWALFLAVRGRTVEATTALPFGPFLAAATWLLWLNFGANPT